MQSLSKVKKTADLWILGVDEKRELECPWGDAAIPPPHYRGAFGASIGL